jgi:hypothetical protein
MALFLEVFAIVLCFLFHLPRFRVCFRIFPFSFNFYKRKRKKPQKNKKASKTPPNRDGRTPVRESDQMHAEGQVKETKVGELAKLIELGQRVWEDEQQEEDVTDRQCHEQGVGTVEGKNCLKLKKF